MQKNTLKFKEVQEQKSPFIVAVPVGRWVEKKEKIPQPRMALSDTPVRALMNERALKKSTIKKFIGKSTAKKENVMVFTGEASKPAGLKSKKKILSEMISTTSSSQIEESCEDPLPLMDIDLNTTFEISPEREKKKPQLIVKDKGLRRSNSMPEIITKTVKHNIRKILTPPVKKSVMKEKAKKANVTSKAAQKLNVAQLKKPVSARIVKSVMPIKTQKSVLIRKPVVVQKAAPVKKELVRKTSSSKQLETREPDIIQVPVELAETKKVNNNPRLVARKEDSVRSKTYKLYKSMMDSQLIFLTAELRKIEEEIGSYFELLDEELQVLVRQAVQQGKLITVDKLKKFELSLLEYENSLSRPDELKRVTEEDVENYWDLLFDEIKNLKEGFAMIENIKNLKLSGIVSQKKHRTRKTYVPDDGTPRRSRRIAENVDTPKYVKDEIFSRQLNLTTYSFSRHNPSCHGCVTMSASKLNTPKSGLKRRTTVSKNVQFKGFTETPKRSENSRSSKRHKATPVRKLVKMDAIDHEDENDFAELL